MNLTWSNAMKKLTISLSVLFAVAVLTTACGQKAEVPAEPAKSTKIFDMPYLMRDLDNGLRVIVVPTDYPDIVSIQIPVQTGSRNEVEPGKTGFAHFFEHMMFRGTEAYPPEVYGDILKKAGADQNAYTTDDYTNYHITFTKDDLEKVIELEADRFQNLKYTEEQFRTEALAVKGEYLKNFSNPLQKLFERISDLMYTQHTYKHTTMGFIEDIEVMPDQMDYAKVFFDRWYRPEKTVVILVGDVDAEETFALVEKYWGDWERGDYAADIPEEPPLAGPKYEHLVWDGPTQPWLVMTYRGPAFVPTEKDMPSLDLISVHLFLGVVRPVPETRDPGTGRRPAVRLFSGPERSGHADDRRAPDRRRTMPSTFAIPSMRRWSRRALSSYPNERSRKRNRDCATDLPRGWTIPPASPRCSRASCISRERRKSSTMLYANLRHTDGQ